MTCHAIKRDSQLYIQSELVKRVLLWIFYNPVEKKVKCILIWRLTLIQQESRYYIQLWDLVSRIQNEMFAFCDSKHDAYLETIQCVAISIGLLSCALFTPSGMKLLSSAMESATPVSSLSAEEEGKHYAMNSALNNKSLLGSHYWLLLYPVKGNVRKNIPFTTICGYTY